MYKSEMNVWILYYAYIDRCLTITCLLIMYFGFSAYGSTTDIAFTSYGCTLLRKELQEP